MGNSGGVVRTATKKQKEEEIRGTYACPECGSDQKIMLDNDHFEVEIDWDCKKREWVADPFPVIPKLGDLQGVICADCWEPPEWLDFNSERFADPPGTRKVLLLPTEEEDAWYDGIESVFDAYRDCAIRYNDVPYYLVKTVPDPRLTFPELQPGELLFLEKVNEWQWKIVKEK
jgi:hypothetical protein